ncbi:MAG: helix-turn-helix domain-containing protein [Dyadobacter sp.]|uniref:helix-turn-helix domain-containing protein n=1 Tax=Dyadobacter sp. TaxID=1914288 RepID=UPI0032656CEC
MNIEVITKEDLQILRRELLEDLKQLLAGSKQEPKKWLRSADVRKMLNISAGTLQNLRANGQLRPSKIGGSYFYAFQDIQSLMQADTKRAR